jgi:hypothetical protein
MRLTRALLLTTIVAACGRTGAAGRTPEAATRAPRTWPLAAGQRAIFDAVVALEETDGGAEMTVAVHDEPGPLKVGLKSVVKAMFRESLVKRSPIYMEVQSATSRITRAAMPSPQFYAMAATPDPSPSDGGSPDLTVTFAPSAAIYRLSGQHVRYAEIRACLERSIRDRSQVWMTFVFGSGALEIVDVRADLGPGAIAD